MVAALIGDGVLYPIPPFIVFLGLLTPEGVVALDGGDGEEGDVGEDGPAEAAELEEVCGSGAGEGSAAGDGEGSFGGEAGVEGGAVENAVVGEEEFDGVAFFVGAVHGDSAGVAEEPAADLRLIEFGFRGFDDDGLVALFEKHQAVRQAGVILGDGLMPGGGPGFALQESPQLFVDSIGEIAVAVHMVVIAEAGDADVERADVFPRIEDLNGTGHTPMRGGEGPVVRCPIRVGAAKCASVRRGGKSGGKRELGGEGLIGSMPRATMRNVVGISPRDDADRSILS